MKKILLVTGIVISAAVIVVFAVLISQTSSQVAQLNNSITSIVTRLDNLQSTPASAVMAQIPPSGAPMANPTTEPAVTPPTPQGPVIDTKIPVGDSVTATQAQIDALITQHPDWGLQIYLDVAQGSVHPGMTKDQVTAAWGKPKSMTTLNDRGDESWSYAHGNSLIFNGDTVSEVQQ